MVYIHVSPKTDVQMLKYSLNLKTQKGRCKGTWMSHCVNTVLPTFFEAHQNAVMVCMGSSRAFYLSNRHTKVHGHISFIYLPPICEKEISVVFHANMCSHSNKKISHTLK